MVEDQALVYANTIPKPTLLSRGTADGAAGGDNNPRLLGTKESSRGPLASMTIRVSRCLLMVRLLS